VIFGILYPAYASFKALKAKNTRQIVKWMMYWIIFALFTTAETLADLLISWLPFYFEIKIVFLIWLLSPATNGTSYLYRRFVHPQLQKHEEEIDKWIAEISKRGCDTVLNWGAKGLNLATTSIMNNIVHFQNQRLLNFTDPIVRSLSMNDVSRLRPPRNSNEAEDEVDSDEINEPSTVKRRVQNSTIPRKGKKAWSTIDNSDSSEILTTELALKQNEMIKLYGDSREKGLNFQMLDDGDSVLVVPRTTRNRLVKKV